jgi:murein DD-endopeptidase MepM/ murein hydrolase activator NlpD
LLPPAWTERPASVRTATEAELHGLWERAGAAYGIPWQVLGAINKIETNFGSNMGPSSAGAVGWMQFMPDTWLRWGMDGDGDGIADPWSPTDAIFAAARYLAAAGGADDLRRSIFAYNHADWYVEDVLELAAVYGSAGVDGSFELDRLALDLEAAQAALAAAGDRLVVAERKERRLAAVESSHRRRLAETDLLSDRLELERLATLAGVDRDAAAAEVAALQEEVAGAETALEEARSASLPASFAPGAAPLFGSPAYSGNYVFPVGGGPGVVSVSHTHHDYPAADIAAPMGAPVYAFTDALVESAWHSPSGACGIGLTFVTGDGVRWTYCHLSYLEPAVQAGTALAAGAPVGLVGSTGHSTGPHLHLQTHPADTLPQELPWFASFAGSAFSWQDEAAAAAAAPPVFAIVEPAPEPAGDVVLFTR